MKSKVKKFIIDALEVLLIAYIIAFLLTHFVISSSIVDGPSMQPTLYTNDYGFSFVISRNIGINRFDIAVIDRGDELLVKRVIGLPNDKVVYKNNELYINDVKYDEDYLGEDAYTNDLEIVLNDDEYFCLGDNRNNSADSRTFGPFKKEQIKSTHLFILYPFDRWGYKK